MNLNPVPGISFIKGISAIILTLLLLTTSCKKESSITAQNTIPSGLKLISSGYAGGAATKVNIYAAADLYVGYNKVYIALYDSASGSQITQAQVSLSTLMSTGVIGPVENPTGTAAVNGLFDAAVVFVSPGSWMLTTNVRNTTNGRTGTSSYSANVIQVSPAKSYTLTAADSSNLFVSIVQPTDPQLGVNAFELVVYKQINALTYTPDSAYMVAINPTMPSMTGMGSPNNVNPIYTGDGHYAGKVDFIMSGGWWVYIDLRHNGVESDTSHYFALNL